MEQVEKLMELLECSEEQAKEIIAYDQEVDKMTVTQCESDLLKEQKAVTKQYRQGDRKPTVYNFSTRERKADNDKGKLIEMLASAINLVTEQEPTITNAERQIDFVYNGRKFRVVLSCPRG